MPRDQVFISYSHEDTKWREDLEKHLKPYLRAGSISSWSDKQISPGSQWFTEIKSTLAQTKVAVLLVTPDFLASDFIHEHELGPLLKEAEGGGITILWVPIYPSAYKQTALEKYQAVLDPNKPLGSLPSKAKRDQAWVKICEEIEKAVSRIDAAIRDQQQRIAAGLEQVRQNAAENSKSGLRADRQRVVGERPSALIDHFKDRETQRNEISRLLANPSTRIVSVIGRGGMGKSALASKILAEMERNRWSHTQEEIPVDGIVYLSTRTNGINLGRLFEDCALMLGGDQSRRLKKVWESRHLTVRDKVEHLLDEMGDGLGAAEPGPAHRDSRTGMLRQLGICCRRPGRGPTMHCLLRTRPAAHRLTAGHERAGRRSHRHPPRSRRARSSVVPEEVNTSTHYRPKSGSNYVGDTSLGAIYSNRLISSCPLLEGLDPTE